MRIRIYSDLHLEFTPFDPPEYDADAMEILANSDAEAVCIVTTDTDFVPLVMRLRERHVTTIVMADARAHESLRSSPHHFVEIVPANSVK